MTLLIFDNEYVTCELDDSIPVLKHRWKSEPPGVKFKENLIRIQQEYIKLSKSYTNMAWLAHAELLGELDEDMEAWLLEEWEDLLFVKAGVKIHAVILGKDIFADYPMEKFKQDAEIKFEKLNVHLGVFSDEPDAYEWIKSIVV